MNESESIISPPPAVADSAPNVTLLVKKGQTEGIRIPCRRVVTLIGSRSGVRVNLQHEKVAPVHLAIVNDGTKVFAVDMLSPTGTLLNGLRMQHEQINDGDRLEIHPFEFIVEIRQPPRNGHDDAHPFDLEPAPQAVALEHMGSGRVLQPNREVCVIGRRNGCDVVINNHQVSRAHALLLSYFERPAIMDLLTPGGTRVNGKPVRFHMLADEDVLTLGDAEVRVRLVESKVAREASSPRITTALRSVEASPVALRPTDKAPDLIDIQSTEQSQRWGVADDLDKLEKVGRKK
ncbi:MAG: FHA domain-containing protein [Phycisphaerales bacterium]|nr:FHA domain-containing protein [Phycisphaerales bacterium]